MELQPSLRGLVQRIESGDRVAEQKLWDEFYQKLLRYVEGKVLRGGVPVGLLDEEAVTASVMESVFKCAKIGRLQNVQNWTEMSRLLRAMTDRKFVDHWRRATALYNYPGRPPEELPVEGVAIPDQALPVSNLMFEEQLSRLMALLPDELHRQIAVYKLAEYTGAEIADKIGKSGATVDRKWRTVLRIWADELKR